MYQHSIILDTILPHAPQSRNGWVTSYDYNLKHFNLEPKLYVWLRDHPANMSYRVEHERHITLYLNFHKHSDMLMFKLTWGGMCAEQ